MAEFEVNDKRKFTAEGERTEGHAVEEPYVITKNVQVTDAEVSKFLAEAPKVYEDPEPLGDRVLIKQHAKETVFKGTTFIIPDVAQKNPNAGIVISVGEGVTTVAPNDLVIFNRYNAEEITLDGEDFIHVDKHDIHLRQKVTYAITKAQD